MEKTRQAAATEGGQRKPSYDVRLWKNHSAVSLRPVFFSGKWYNATGVPFPVTDNRGAAMTLLNSRYREHK